MVESSRRPRFESRLGQVLVENRLGGIPGADHRLVKVSVLPETSQCAQQRGVGVVVGVGIVKPRDHRR